MDEDEILKRLMAQDQMNQEGNPQGANLMQPPLPEDKNSLLNRLQQQKVQALGANQVALQKQAQGGLGQNLAGNQAQQAENDAIRFARIKQMLRNQQ